MKETRALEIKVVGLANSKKMVFDENSINLDNWKNALQNSDLEMKTSGFINTMKNLNLENSIFIDNTASDQIAAYYEAILDSSISISTPNKIATSSTYSQYQRLKNIANKRGVQFMYETNVGAGLPVISTLNDLITSGDNILKIEGILSGSLSFIFNSFSSKKSFSEIVLEAKERGFTEPDPRIDLNGIDVRRKLLILARESGMSLEANDVIINNILPKECQEAETVEAFFEALENANPQFQALVKEAEDKGMRLRMIAKLEKDHASIGLEMVDGNHPFYNLSGSDNMIVFTTERYKERPLVVRGPGAGAEVTAAGVFAEIVTIGNYLS